MDFRHAQTAIPVEVLQERMPVIMRRALASGIGIYISIEYSEFREWIESMSKSTVIVFACESGVLADEAVLYARRFGWRKTYSIKV